MERGTSICIKMVKRRHYNFTHFSGEVSGSIKVPLSRQTSIDGGQMALSASSLKKILASKKSMNELSRPQLRKLAAEIFQVSIKWDFDN